MFHAEYSSGQPLRMLVDLRAAVDEALQVRSTQRRYPCRRRIVERHRRRKAQLVPRKLKSATMKTPSPDGADSFERPRLLPGTDRELAQARRGAGVCPARTGSLPRTSTRTYDLAIAEAVTGEKRVNLRQGLAAAGSLPLWCIPTPLTILAASTVRFSSVARPPLMAGHARSSGAAKSFAGRKPRRAPRSLTDSTLQPTPNRTLDASWSRCITP